jgi:hypothetical protein
MKVEVSFNHWRGGWISVRCVAFVLSIETRIMVLIFYPHSTNLDEYILHIIRFNLRPWQHIFSLKGQLSRFHTFHQRDEFFKNLNVREITEYLLRWNLILHGNRRSRSVLRHYPLKWQEWTIKFTQYRRSQLMRKKFSVPNVLRGSLKISNKILTVTHVKILSSR